MTFMRLKPEPFSAGGINLKLHFSKMHGLKNDYVYINCLSEKLKHPQEVARLISDRHCGVGSDGLILICPSDRADFAMGRRAICAVMVSGVWGSTSMTTG